MAKHKVSYHRVQTPGLTVEGKQARRITVANALVDVRLHCVGDDDEVIGDDFKIPSDPEQLRALAKALTETAREIESWRNG